MADSVEEGAGGGITELAAGLRARHALGRSPGLNRLFDYLAECAQAGMRPKEFEVAAAVFGRDSGFDGGQDASVRVAVHRLRRKLDDFYAGPGREEPARLTIPKGEYRMVVEERPMAAVAAAARLAALGDRRGRAGAGAQPRGLGGVLVDPRQRASPGARAG